MHKSNSSKTIKSKSSKKEEELQKPGIFEYNKILNYFMTVFFIFVLMIFFLLIITLSRIVLSDSTFERHVIETRSLIEELERFERSRPDLYENVSLDMDDHIRNSILYRLELDDVALISSQSSDISFITLRTSKYEFESVGNFIIITNLEPQVNDQVLISTSQGSIQHAVIIDDSPPSRIGGIAVLINNEEFEEIDNIIEVIEPTSILGVVLLKEN